jgi:hypothetical protein
LKTQLPNPAPNNRAQWLLLLGAAIGLLLASSGLLNNSDTNNSTAIATVNTKIISKEDYLHYLTLLAKDKRNPLTSADHRHILNRMLEEKLLIERAVDLGLVESDSNVRTTIINAMIQTVIAEISNNAVSDSELAEFYRDNEHYFSAPARIQLQRISFSNNDPKQAQQQAETARQRLLNGASYKQIRREFGSSNMVEVPNALLPPIKLQQYLGPTLTAQALTMKPGEISAPLADENGYSLLLLIAQQPADPKPLAEIYDLVSNEYRRRAADKALQDYLQQLRLQADINIDEDFINSLADAAAAKEK